jgi:hypothetical protein
MEAVMPSTTVSPGTTSPGTTETAQLRWIVEFNLAGFRVLRRAEKRRHLLGFNPGGFIPVPASRPSEAV